MLRSALLFCSCLIFMSCQAEDDRYRVADTPDDTIQDHTFVVDGTYNPENHGYEVNDTVPNIRLEDINGDFFELKSSLKSQEYVLLISGSYTCPMMRNSVSTIKKIQYVFDEVKPIIVYGFEAHPHSGKVIFGENHRISNKNAAIGIEYGQHESMEDRREMAQILKDSSQLDVDILIDSKDNHYAKKFGIGPHSAYLIDKSGVVRIRHNFFNLKGESIFQDLNEIIEEDLEKTKN